MNWRCVLTQRDKLIRFASHCRNNNSNLMTRVNFAFHMPRNIPNALNCCDRSAAKFHDKTRH
jgi:hypothetical protein